MNSAHEFHEKERTETEIYNALLFQGIHLPLSWFALNPWYLFLFLHAN